MGWGECFAEGSNAKAARFSLLPVTSRKWKGSKYLATKLAADLDRGEWEPCQYSHVLMCLAHLWHCVLS